jgi:ABC-type glycerol-3-phosphate transport system substrate-binding protein
MAIAGTVFAEPLRAAAPPSATITPALIDAARKEGKISYYAAIELNVAERLGKMFEAKYPGIAVRVERSGAERIFQRIAQEQGSGIHAVDVANSTDTAHYLDWKKNGWLAPYLPEEVAKNFFQPISSIRKGCMRPHVPGSKPSVTTRTWSNARMPRKVTPTCSTRNGRAKSSRAIPATAAPF